MNGQRKAYILAGLAVIFWSTSASAFKISLRYISYPQLLLFSSFSAFSVLFFLVIAKAEVKRMLRLNIKDLLYSILLGFFNPFLYYIILFKAYSLIPAQQAQPLNFIWPIMLVLLSIPLLKQKIHFKQILALIICFLGVVIISTQGDLYGFSMSDPLGIALALGSSVIWALFWLINMRDKRDDLHKLVLSFFFGTCFTFVYMICFSKFEITQWQGIAGSVYIGFFEMGITFYIWLSALKLSRTTAEVNILIYLTPLLALVFISLLVGETITVPTIIGVLLIISGIAFNNWLKQKN
ncbi:DMT family transporter [Candidatus Cloacimonadota bacterium]